MDIIPKEVIEQALSVEQRAQELVIRTVDDFNLAGDWIKTIKALRMKIAAGYDPIIKQAHITWKEANKTKSDAERPLVMAEGILRPKIADYIVEQKRLAKLEEERLRTEARKQEEERKLSQAEHLEAQGRKEEADRVLDTRPIIPPVTVDPPKKEGISTREKWEYRITNESLIPREFLIPDAKKIQAIVNAMKDQTVIPGIEVYPDNRLVIR